MTTTSEETQTNGYVYLSHGTGCRKGQDIPEDCRVSLDEAEHKPHLPRQDHTHQEVAGRIDIDSKHHVQSGDVMLGLESVLRHTC